MFFLVFFYFVIFCETGISDHFLTRIEFKNPTQYVHMLQHTNA